MNQKVVSLLSFLTAVALAPALPMTAVAQLGAAGIQFFDQESPGIPDHNDEDERFGYALASGDFDGDGYVDLAVGAPFEGIYGDDSGGAVTVIPGSPNGLDPLLGAEQWSRSLGLLTGDVGVGDVLGHQLASADFDQDGYHDLAISVLGDNLVFVLWGSGSGLTHVGHLAIERGTHGIPGSPSQESFGSALTTGDFDGDGFPDLAIGISAHDPLHGGGLVNAAGAVTVLYGSEQGLDGSPGNGVPGRLWTRADLGLDPVELGFFGGELASGDFDADGYDDLVIGAPNESLQLTAGPAVHEAGAAYLLRGGADGLTGTGGRFFHRAMPGFYGNPDASDHLGGALAAGDFDGDGDDDLVIGVPRADLLADNVGIAYVLEGAPSVGLSSTATLMTRGTIGGGLPGAGDLFAARLGSGDFDGDGRDDLVVSALRARSPSDVWSGVVWLVRGSSSGLDQSAQTLHHDLALPGTESPDIDFGDALELGDFDGNGAPDLAVGVGRWRPAAAPATDAYGAVDVFASPAQDVIFSDDFESGLLSEWSSVSG